MDKNYGEERVKKLRGFYIFNIHIDDIIFCLVFGDFQQLTN
jgi:hypothetical protein